MSGSSGTIKITIVSNVKGIDTSDGGYTSTSDARMILYVNDTEYNTYGPVTGTDGYSGYADKTNTYNISGLKDGDILTWKVRCTTTHPYTVNIRTMCTKFIVTQVQYTLQTDINVSFKKST